MNIYQGRADRGQFATLLQQQRELGHQPVGGKGWVQGLARALGRGRRAVPLHEDNRGSHRSGLMLRGLWVLGQKLRPTQL